MSFFLIVYFFAGFVKRTLFTARIPCYTVAMEHLELYQMQEADAANTRRRKALTAMITAGAIGLLTCVLLCLFVTRKNSMKILPFVIGASILSGWTVIFLSHTFYGEARAAVRHDEMMLTGERETFVGRFQKTDEVHRVKNGVTVRKIIALCDERERVLSVSEQKAALLPDTFDGKVEAVYDFIAAIEVQNDD